MPTISERLRIAGTADLLPLSTEAANTIELLVSALSIIPWKSTDQNDMEFTARITHHQMGCIRAALARFGEAEDQETNWHHAYIGANLAWLKAEETIDALVAALNAANKTLWEEGYSVTHPIAKQIDAALALARGDV
jgi:hypothetical protein